MADARRRLGRPLHDHARQHRRERRAAVDPARPRADLSELEWIVTGYALTFASLMLVGGKVADAYGRRRIFVLGIVVFTLASFSAGSRARRRCSSAHASARCGAALMNPATLSIIAATFPSARHGDRHLGRRLALALAIGPLVGGLITEHLDWSWIFFVNVPVGVARDRGQLSSSTSRATRRTRASTSRA